MANCGQVCPYNTLDGCKVKEYNAICPLTNMATPITEYRMTNADRIRAMSDEELAEFICEVYDEDEDNAKFINGYYIPCYNQYSIKEWLEQPAEGER